MPTFTIDMAVIVSVCTVIAAVGGAFVWVKKAMDSLLRPVKTMQVEIDSLREKTDHNYERLNEHERVLEEVRTDNREMLKAVLLLLSHIETGNNTGEVAKGRKDLEHYLLER